MRRLGVVLGLLALAAAALVTLRTGGEPRASIEPGLPAIGRATPVVFRAAEPGRGIASLRAELVQGGESRVLFEESYSTRPAWAYWGPRQAEVEIEWTVGSSTIPGLTGGEATLRLSVWPAATWLRRPEPTVEEVALPVRLTPPTLAVLSSQHYVAQGGCELVLYRVGETAARSGVEHGDWFFPGLPLPGGDAQARFALFSVPWDAESAEGTRLVAIDDVGNRAELAFVDRFFPRPPSTDTISLADPFLAKVVPEIMTNTPELEDRGGLLANYLQINGELRERNAARLIELAGRSADGFLWRQPFLQMPDTQVMSSFADRRTYLYEGREVDHQTHLGFDLASVERAPVPAANRGRVLQAGYFGIYGNAVVLDHGAGLTSLYGHLSSIEVREGDLVEQGQTVGRTGATGLAGGDHLHFTMLLRGLPVTPVEWWDGHWIQDRLRRKLGETWPTARSPQSR